MHYEKNTTLPTNKSLKSKSPQQITHTPQEELSGQSSKSIFPSQKQTSAKLLKFSKFDTPEKKNSPKPDRDTQKSSSKPDHSTPFPQNTQFFSKNNLNNLTKQQKNNLSKFKLKKFAPVLFRRKPGKPKKNPNLLAKSETETSEPPLPEKIYEKLGAQEVPDLKALEGNIFVASFEEETENEVVFLSDRMCFDCENGQILRLELKKVESDEWENSENGTYEKFDCETQTEEDEIEGMLKVLENQDVQTGIKFISKIAKFMQTLGDVI